MHDHKKIVRSTSIIVTWVNVIVEVFPLIKPDLRQTGIVVVDDAAGSPRERVRSRLTEHMPDVRACRYFQGAPAHPHLGPHAC